MRLHPLLRALGEALVTVVAPSRCAACDVPAPFATAFCPVCAATLVPARVDDPDRIAAFVYGGAIAETLRKLKFDDRPDLARPLLAGLVRRLALLRERRVDLVVPVPLHPSRLVERGYNQAALLARPLARILGVPCLPRGLSRPVPTERQTDLSRAERAANVDRAFVPTDAAPLSGRRVLVVDDVETTGATLDACRHALASAGATYVSTVVIARAVPEDGA